MMKSSAFTATLAAASWFCSHPFVASADTAFQLDLCADSRTSGWSFYCKPPVEETVQEEQPDPEPVVPVVVPPAPPATEDATEPKPGPATIAILEFRAMVDDIKHRAVLDPTRENVLAYMEINKQIAEQAGAFTDQWQRILFETPHLDANVEYPLASAGIGVYQDQLKAARLASFKETAATKGILFLFEDPNACGICTVQGEVLAAMQDIYGVSILAVSRDGSTIPTFPNAVTDNGQLTSMGLDAYPAPTLAMVDPSTNEVSVIGSGLLTADQVLERVYVITEVPVGERY